MALMCLNVSVRPSVTFYCPFPPAKVGNLKKKNNIQNKVHKDHRHSALKNPLKFNSPPPQDIGHFYSCNH